MRTWTTGANATAEDSALGTALHTEIAGFTEWTFVDGGAAGCALGDGRCLRCVGPCPAEFPLY